MDYPERTFSDGAKAASLVPNAVLVNRAGENAPLLNPDLPEPFTLVRSFIHEHTPARDSAARLPAAVDLTPRQVEVLRLVAAGKSNTQIADALVIASATAARHVHNILTKTTLSNRAELPAYALRHGLAK